MFDHNCKVEGKRPKRRLDGISHFFLSHHSLPGKERRIKKERMRANAARPITLAEEKPEKRSEEVSSAAEIEHNQCLVFSTYDLFAAKAFLAYKLTFELSRRDFSVGLIDTSTATLSKLSEAQRLASRSTNTASSFSPAKDNSTRSRIGQASQQFSPMKDTVGSGARIRARYLAEKGFDSEASVGIVKRMTKESNFLIINSPRDISKLRGVISILNPLFIVPITVNSKVLLRSYMLIKEILVDMHVEEVGVLVMDEKPNSRGEKAFCLVAEMVHKFLLSTVFFMGVIPFKAPPEHSTLSPNQMRQKTGESAISRSICELADAVIEQLNHR